MGSIALGSLSDCSLPKPVPAPYLCGMLHTMFLCALGLCFLSVSGQQYFRTSSPFTYVCRENKCIKMDRQDAKEILTLERCKLTCGPFGALWPKPSGKVTLGTNVVSFLPENVEIKGMTAPSADIKELLVEAADIFRENIKYINPMYRDKGDKAYNEDYPDNVKTSKIYLEFSVVSNVRNLELHRDESYTLGLNNVRGNVVVNILANTFFGVRHGLQTLSQLMEYDSLLNCLIIVDKSIISDKPTFTYRAITLDTSRNFYSIKSIKRMIDAMSYNKLNTLHWHITDTHSFPFFSKRVPQMVVYGAYSPYQVYYPEDIVDIVKYARVRGVRIIPEIDAPAHVGNGWQWAEKEGKGRMAVCVNQEPWKKYCVEPPCGQLNPLHEGMYNVLGEIFKDILDVFSTDVFHMGGDEVNVNCWNTSQEIIDWMTTEGRERNATDFLDLWNSFQVKAYDKLVEANNGKDMKAILWTSELTAEGHLGKYLDPEKYIIQLWSDVNNSVIAHIVEEGFPVIFTPWDKWYLDCGFGAWVGEGNNWCSPYKGWKTIYDVNPYTVLTNLNVTLDPVVDNARVPVIAHASPRELVLGGAVAMWSEQVDEHSVEMKVWPRAAALAERLWSNPESSWEAAESRFINNRDRMVNLGIGADAEQPRWCHQNDGLCYA